MATFQLPIVMNYFNFARHAPGPCSLNMIIYKTFFYCCNPPQPPCVHFALWCCFYLINTWTTTAIPGPSPTRELSKRKTNYSLTYSLNFFRYIRCTRFSFNLFTSNFLGIFGEIFLNKKLCVCDAFFVGGTAEDLNYLKVVCKSTVFNVRRRGLLHSVVKISLKAKFLIFSKHSWTLVETTRKL